MAGDLSSVATSGSKKKKKGFKSLAKGFSFKKKKQRPDDDSVVGVALEREDSGGGPPASVRSGGAAMSNGGGATARVAPVAPTPTPIQVVLLLMDPSSRRFELLQLEFDVNKAYVHNVMDQIRDSATEKSLRDITFVGVCNQAGQEMMGTMKLSQFCQGNEVIVAMPQGMSGKDTAKISEPILSDPKVIEMLAPCGVIIKPMKKSRSSGPKMTQIAEEDSRRKETKTPSPTNAPSSQRAGPAKSVGDKAAKKKKSSSGLSTFLLGVIMSSLVYFTIERHFKVTRPLESGDVLLPGQWRSQCGIFDLFPTEWLDKLPMDKLAPSCDTSTSSMLELGRDGTLRYFAKSGGGERKDTWSVPGSKKVEQCLEEGGEECVAGATFVKDEKNNWYVEMEGARTLLSKDVVSDFATEI